MDDDKISSLKPKIHQFLDGRSHLIADQLQAYRNLGRGYSAHDWVNHGKKEFVNGNIIHQKRRTKQMVRDNVQKTNGKCLCRQVQFEIQGELRDIVNCHCSKCRKFHGHYGAYTSVKVENLKITEQKSLKWYNSPTDETANVRRGFCSECGSSLFWHPKDQPAIAIAAGSLDSPTNLKTIGHIWCSQISDYYKIEDDLPQFDERWSA